jgi:hypothetical protein
MAIEIGRYQFHPWARRGIAANIAEGDDLGTGSAANLERAVVPIGVSLNGAGLSKNFALISPGDIIGINSDMIVRTEPRNWITDYEPNYLAFVEFYDEDFAWRYTPAKAAGDKLRPWIALLVLEDAEFTRSQRKMPLPGITVANKAALPPHDETWLWAHVHSNADIPDSELSNFEKFLLSLNATRNDDPDHFYCRLMSARHLKPNAAYTAFLVPAFETGRLAGLGESQDKIKTIKAQQPSWTTAGGANGEMPVYFEWCFRTGEKVDFEELVKALLPRPMDHRVGIRDMDASRPGFVRADNPLLEIPGTSPQIIGLEGALKSPSAVSTVFPDPPAARDFQVELQKIVNIAATQPANLLQDPIITVPLYGGRHAKKSATDVVTLDIDSKSWVNDLNRDPRTRVPAGFGTRVVQKNQETYMREAWRQVERILDLNRRIRSTVFNMLVATGYMRQTFDKLKIGPLLALSKPVLSKVMGSATTLYHQLRESRLPAAVVSGTFRRLVRPNGKLVKKLGVDTRFDYSSLVQGLNDGSLTAAPPKQLPAGLPNTEDFANQILSRKLPAWVEWLTKHPLLLLIALLILLAVLAFSTGAFIVFAVLAIGAVAGYGYASVYAETLKRSDRAVAEILLDPTKQSEAIASIPPQPNFALTISDELNPPPATLTSAGNDSVEAKNYRAALADRVRRMAITVPQKVLQPFDLANAHGKVSVALNPRLSFPRRLSATVRVPNYIKLDVPELMFPAMAYPDIIDPMYKPLADISQDLILPNVKLIPPNTISLLKTNQKFIESYLVGLNHEMGHELLWREYPTDERGSYFRQFWDVNGIIRPKSAEVAAAHTAVQIAALNAKLAEDHKDIKPIDTWKRASTLDSHNNRSSTGATSQVVLVIRGDLLKRYPNTLIFAQKAIPGNPLLIDPQIDTDLTPAEFDTELMFPLYKGDLPPDIKFFGFDMTIEQAKGTEPLGDFTDKLGWFFVIQEVPGEPRFGMDLSFDPGTDGLSWDDLAWDKFGAEISFIKKDVKPNLGLPVADQNMWGVDSAKMAFILFQKPSMVAVHASEMLENLTM